MAFLAGRFHKCSSNYNFFKESKMQGKKLFIGNFSYDTTEADLRDLFSEHGKVVDMRIIGDKGFGFVEMDTQLEAEKAKEVLDGRELNGRSLRVDEARKDQGSPSGRRGGKPGGGYGGGGGGYGGGGKGGRGGKGGYGKKR